MILPAVPPPHAAPALAHHFRTPVQHIVVIVQENRTVDYLFNGFPGADTVTVDPYTGTVLKPLSLIAACYPGATHADFVADFDGGKMDGFQHGLAKGCTAYAFAPHAEIVRYRHFAAANVLADETFQSNQSNSYPAHQYLYAGRSCSYPHDVYCLAENANGAAYCGAPKSVTVAEMNMTSAYPGKESRTGPPCKAYTSTILDEIAAARLSWRYYVYDDESIWGGPSSYQACWKSAGCMANVVTPPKTVLRDIAAHRLANLAFVTPEPNRSDHPGNMTVAEAGEDWVAQVVNAIGKDPYYWPHTTILLTWDDWGGWYDHAVPPAAPFYEDPYEFGFRVPLVVGGAYVQAGSVDHTVRNVYGGVLRYIESTFDLASLQQTDAPNLTDDLTALFHYAQRPNVFVPM